jgi:hypothetical protein
VRGRISKLKDKTEINENKRTLSQKLKSYERNIQELNVSIKRPNLRIMGIEE